jgi:hypothetical protein
MTRELRNTVFMWAVFMIILLIMSFQLINNPAQDMNQIKAKTNSDCTPTSDNGFCKLEDFRNDSDYKEKLEKYKTEHEEFSDLCCKRLLIWYLCYLGLVILKFGFSMYAYCKVSNEHYETLTQIKQSIRANEAL